MVVVDIVTLLTRWKVEQEREADKKQVLKADLKINKSFCSVSEIMPILTQFLSCLRIRTETPAAAGVQQQMTGS